MYVCIHLNNAYEISHFFDTQLNPPTTPLPRFLRCLGIPGAMCQGLKISSPSLPPKSIPRPRNGRDRPIVGVFVDHQKNLAD